MHGGISHSLLSTAEWLDSFFMDDRSVHEANRTYFLVRYDLFKEEASDFKSLPSMNLRLNLPQLQHKTQFVFSAEPNAEPAPAAGSTSPVTPATERPGTSAAPANRNLTAAVHYLFRSTVEESASVKVGSLLSSGSPVLFVSPRYRASKSLKPWDFRFTEEVTWRTDNGWESDTAFDIERPLPHELFFRTSASGVWQEKVKGYFYALSASVRQPFGLEHAVNYEWINSYRTNPSNELTEVAFRIRYRHSFLRQWIFFEVAPQYRFPRDKNFDGFAGILFRVEAFFGVNP